MIFTPLYFLPWRMSKFIIPRICISFVARGKSYNTFLLFLIVVYYPYAVTRKLAQPVLENSASAHRAWSSFLIRRQRERRFFTSVPVRRASRS